MPQALSQLTDADLDALLKPLGSGRVPKSPESAEARNRLLQMGTEVVPRLLKIIAQEGDKRRQRQAIAAVFTVMLALPALAGLLSGGLWAALAIAGLLGLGIFTAPLHTIPARQRQAIQALALFEDVQTVGTLIDTLAYGEGTSNGFVREALTRLLPRLQTEDANLLTPARREILYGQLKMAYAVKMPEFQCAILEMLGRLGGREALPMVGWLVISNAPTAKEQQVRHAAEQCLSHLMERIDFGGVEQIGKLASHLSAPLDLQPSHWGQYIDARLALIKLLPQAQAETFAQLKPNERESLYTQLTDEMEMHGGISNLARLGPGLELALLEAFERTEYIEALSSVRAVAHGEASTTSRQHIRTAARSCLRVLAAAAARKKVGETLLRASEAPQTASDILLRPAAGAPDTQPQQLLRASLNEPE